MKDTLIESASSAMDMEKGDVPEAGTDSVYDSRSGPPPRFKGYRRNSEVMNAPGVTVEAWQNSASWQRGKGTTK